MEERVKEAEEVKFMCTADYYLVMGLEKRLIQYNKRL
jgi:hypothetical protein